MEHSRYLPDLSASRWPGVDLAVECVRHQKVIQHTRGQRLDLDIVSSRVAIHSRTPGTLKNSTVRRIQFPVEFNRHVNSILKDEQHPDILLPLRSNCQRTPALESACGHVLPCGMLSFPYSFVSFRVSDGGERLSPNARAARALIRA